MIAGISAAKLGNSASKGALFGCFRSSSGRSCWFGRRLGGGGSLGRGADGGFSYENGTGFDGEGLGLDVADDFTAGLELDAVGGGDIAVDLTINDDGCGFDFRLDAGVFADGEAAVGVDFTFDFAIDDEVVGEFDGAFDFDIRGEDVASGCGCGTHRSGGRCGLRRAVGR